MPALFVSKPQRRKVQGEITDFWYVRVTRSDGKRTWRTTATSDHKEALEFRKKLFDEYAREEKKLARRPLGSCLDEWLESKRSRVAQSSYETIEGKVKQIRKHFGEVTGVSSQVPDLDYARWWQQARTVRQGAIRDSDRAGAA